MKKNYFKEYLYKFTNTLVDYDDNSTSYLVVSNCRLHSKSEVLSLNCSNVISNIYK